MVLIGLRHLIGDPRGFLRLLFVDADRDNAGIMLRPQIHPGLKHRHGFGSVERIASPIALAPLLVQIESLDDGAEYLFGAYDFTFSLNQVRIIIADARGFVRPSAFRGVRRHLDSGRADKGPWHYGSH